MSDRGWHHCASGIPPTLLYATELRPSYLILPPRPSPENISGLKYGNTAAFFHIHNLVYIDRWNGNSCIAALSMSFA